MPFACCRGTLFGRTERDKCNCGNPAGTSDAFRRLFSTGVSRQSAPPTCLPLFLESRELMTMFLSRCCGALAMAVAVVSGTLFAGETPRGGQFPESPARSSKPAARRGPAEVKEGNHEKGRSEGEPAGESVVRLGYLIADGRYLAPPYRLTTNGSTVRINGVVFAAGKLVSEPRGSRGAERRGQRSAPRRSSTGNSVRSQLEETLADDGIIMKFHDDSFTCDGDALYVLNTLLSEDSATEKLQALMAGADRRVTRDQWSALIAAFHPTEELKARVQAYLDSCEKRFDALPVASRQHSRLYLLTVLGMVLTVLAFGMVLSHRPVFGAKWAELHRDRESLRLVFGCAGLIAALSIFDLVCTLIANQSAGFWEVNPLGAAIASPGMLIVFKLVATAISVSILLGLRCYRGVQVASWWLCLGLALLAARWVVFNSFMMG